MAFKDWLEKVEAEKATENQPAQPEPAAPGEALPPDPYAHLIGRRTDEGEGGLAPKSPFDAFLDEVDASKPDDWVKPAKEASCHDWDMVRGAVYSQDHVVWLCSKCCRTVSVERDETLKTALDKIGIKDDCSLQVVSEVQDE